MADAGMTCRQRIVFIEQLLNLDANIMNTLRQIRNVIYFLGAVLVLAMPRVWAEETATADLAKAAQNPLASMISLPFQINTNTNVGPLDETQNILNIQPVWPIDWSDNWNLITRTIVPVVSQPAMSATGSRKSGLGDITFYWVFCAQGN